MKKNYRTNKLIKDTEKELKILSDQVLNYFNKWPGLKKLIKENTFIAGKGINTLAHEKKIVNLKFYFQSKKALEKFKKYQDKQSFKNYFNKVNDLVLVNPTTKDSIDLKAHSESNSNTFSFTDSSSTLMFVKFFLNCHYENPQLFYDDQTFTCFCNYYELSSEKLVIKYPKLFLEKKFSTNIDWFTGHVVDFDHCNMSEDHGWEYIKIPEHSVSVNFK